MHDKVSQELTAAAAAHDTNAAIYIASEAGAGEAAVAAPTAAG